MISLPPSDEVYLLQKYRWFILASQPNIKYHSGPRMDSHFRCLMNTYDYEDALFRIDYRLKEFRDLKEIYTQFNNRTSGNLEIRCPGSGNHHMRVYSRNVLSKP